MADQKIDVHSHFLSPLYRTALLENGYTMPDGMGGVPEWDLDSHLAYMDSVGVKKSILSISSPGTNITHNISDAIALARHTNEFAADLKRKHPDRFGFFASLPMPDIEASIKEIKHCIHALNPDGFVLESNSEGAYLGDPIIRRVLDVLDNHSALVFMHPTSPCRYSAIPSQETPDEAYAASAPLATHYSAPTFEFFFDSARSIIDLLATGQILRFPRIRWIVSHCGGVLPLLIDRLILVTGLPHPVAVARDTIPIDEDKIRNTFKESFWFDLAGRPLPHQVGAMLNHTGKDRLLFGSDVPWTPWELAKDLTKQVDQGLAAAVGAENVDAVYRGTAEKLLSHGKTHSVPMTL